MPEGDAIHRAARRLQALVGEEVEIETPHPRAAATRIVERLGSPRRLEAVEAVGKNLLLRFDGGLVVRSHLRMNGRWRVRQRGAADVGRPWLVLRGARLEAVQWNGPVLELVSGKQLRVGPDILAAGFDTGNAIARLRTEPALPLGEALQRQALVGGIGNMWMAEALWEARLSPWLLVGEVGDAELRSALESARRLMRAGLDGRRGPRRAYRRAGRPCPRCGEPIRSRGQGDANRTAYWCPVCQPAPAAPD